MFEPFKNKWQAMTVYQQFCIIVFVVHLLSLVWLTVMLTGFAGGVLLGLDLSGEFSPLLDLLVQRLLP